MRKVICVLIVLVLVGLCSFAGAEKDDKIIGTISGDVYNNDYIGITCCFPGMTFASLPELAKKNNISADKLSILTWSDIEEGNKFTVMKAETPTPTDYCTVIISINCEKENIILNTVGWEKWLDFIKPFMIKRYEDYGYTVTGDVDTIRIRLGEEECWGIKYSIDYNGITFHILQLFKQIDSISVTITITALNENSIETALSGISSVSDR